MSPALFNIFIKEVVNQGHAGETSIWLGKEGFSVLAFADDLVAIGGFFLFQTKST